MTGAKPTILVIDDSRVTQHMVRLILKREGFEVVTTGNGLIAQSALAHLEETPAVIVCDIDMPEMDGFGFLEWLKSEPDYADIPVIMLTAMGDDANHTKAHDLGANAVITQPFDSQYLVETVQSFLTPAT